MILKTQNRRLDGVGAQLLPGCWLQDRATQHSSSVLPLFLKWLVSTFLGAITFIACKHLGPLAENKDIASPKKTDKSC